MTRWLWLKRELRRETIAIVVIVLSVSACAGIAWLGHWLWESVVMWLAR